jgi:glycosyltransferase involved in cell wall biosynthesis
LTRSLRIAFVTNLYPPIQTGSSFWTQDAATVLARRGHHVIVITCGPGAEHVEETAGVRIYRLSATFHLPRWVFFLRFDQFYLMTSRRNARRIREILREERIDVVHQAGHLLDSTFLSSNAARALAIPAVCSIHTRIGHPTSRLYDAAMRWVDRFVLGPLAMRRFARLIAVDNVLRRHYERVYRVRDIRCVPVCVHDQILEGDVARPGDGPVRIVSVGHVTAMRDRRELLTAIAELRRRGHAVRLEIAGKLLTDVTPRLIRELGLDGTVTLLGELPREELLQLLRGASLEAHWIDIQGVGSAGIEAMALGLPVAAWAPADIYGDVPLRHLENIVLIDPHDHQSLVAMLERLVLEPELRRKIGTNARDLVRGHLTWSSVAAGLESVYVEAMAAA